MYVCTSKPDQIVSILFIHDGGSSTFSSVVNTVGSSSPSRVLEQSQRIIFPFLYGEPEESKPFTVKEPSDLLVLIRTSVVIWEKEAIVVAVILKSVLEELSQSLLLFVTFGGAEEADQRFRGGKSEGQVWW